MEDVLSLSMVNSAPVGPVRYSVKGYTKIKRIQCELFSEKYYYDIHQKLYDYNWQYNGV